ncbi:MAG: hypothetical protein AAGU27_13285 [Dehalobacterium sp.]
MLHEEAAVDALDDFSDSQEISAYAKQLINSLVAEGYVHGADSKLFVESNATRAEAAQFLYNIVRKVLGK